MTLRVVRSDRPVGELDLDLTTFYVLSGDYVAYLCPCEKHHLIMLPIKPRDNGWEYTENDGKPTMNPSIFTHGPLCESHYFIRDGEFVW